MIPLILSLLFIALLTLLVGRYSFRNKQDEAPVAAQQPADCATCSVMPVSCDTECSTNSASSEPVYFDDEELDRFIRRPSDRYSEEDVDEFADVLHTMREEDIVPWLQSLKQRDIALPDQLKEEVAFYLQG